MYHVFHNDDSNLTPIGLLLIQQFHVQYKCHLLKFHLFQVVENVSSSPHSSMNIILVLCVGQAKDAEECATLRAVSQHRASEYAMH